MFYRILNFLGHLKHLNLDTEGLPERQEDKLKYLHGDP